MQFPEERLTILPCRVIRLIVAKPAVDGRVNSNLLVEIHIYIDSVLGQAGGSGGEQQAETDDGCGSRHRVHQHQSQLRGSEVEFEGKLNLPWIGGGTKNLASGGSIDRGAG